MARMLFRTTGFSRHNELGSVCKEIILNPYSVVRLSTTTGLMSNRNKPRNSGDKGPEKNYKRKLVKRANKEIGAALLKGLKDSEGNDPSGVSEDNIRFIGRSMRYLAGESFVEGTQKRRQIKSKMKKSGANLISGGRWYKAKQSMKPINFYSGVKLDIFSPLGGEMEVMPTWHQSLAEEDEQNGMEEIRLLQTTSYFEDLIMRRGVLYPRKFPIDNEDYEHGEKEVSFKDHVLLDHVIKDFPAKGPVRHFLELVVTGLSMNPDYTVQEKHDFINWYKSFFSEFSSEELQALSPDDTLKPDTNATGK